MFVNSSFVKVMNYNTIRLDRLKCLRDNVNWEVEKERHELFNEFYRVLNDWDGRLSDLQRIFRPEQVEILLSDTIDRWSTEDNLLAPFVSFLVQTGYKDKPKVDQDGKFILRRRTPLLLACYEEIHSVACELFKIYDRFDINYIDEKSGYTHLHAACELGCTEVVEKFLEAGQDPNLIIAEPGYSLLHLALRSPYTSPEMVSTLLKHGANPNVADNIIGLTAVHLIAMGPEDSDLMQMLIDLTDYKHQPVRIHLRDKDGSTALHYAVSNGLKIMTETLLKNGAEPNCIDETGTTPLHSVCMENNENPELAKILIKLGASIDAQDKDGYTPLHHSVDCSDHSVAELLLRNGADPYISNKYGYNALQYAVAILDPDLVDVFLDNGVDLSSFVFPTAKQFDETNAYRKYCQLKLASSLLIVVERLEKKGYELVRSDALTIMEFLTQLIDLLVSSDAEESWYDDETFAIEAKKIMVNPSLSLYELTRLGYKEAAKQLTYEGYLELWRSEKLLDLPEEFIDDCAKHLCEKLTRRFFRTWTLYPFWEQIVHYRLAILCCDMIMDHLTNKDLFNICLAAAK